MGWSDLLAGATSHAAWPARFRVEAASVRTARTGHRAWRDGLRPPYGWPRRATLPPPRFLFVINLPLGLVGVTW